MEKTYEIKVTLRFKGSSSDRAVLRFVGNAVQNHIDDTEGANNKLVVVGVVKTNTLTVTKHLD